MPATAEVAVIGRAPPKPVGSTTNDKGTSMKRHVFTNRFEWSSVFALGAILCASAAPGCTAETAPAEGATEDTAAAGNAAEAAHPAASEDDHPPPAATIATQNGTTVEVYNFHSAVLVLERGEAYTTPTMPAIADAVKANRLDRVYAILRPNTPVPAELLAVQEEVAQNSATAVSEAVDAKIVTQPDAGATAPSWGGGKIGATKGAVTAATLIGCSNGCCDPDWTLNTLCSYISQGDYSWYGFDYGYTWANGGGIDLFKGTACSAVGTSTFQVHISDGSGGTWSVAEAHYLTWGWGGSFFARSYASTVNSQANEHLHTYCGEVVNGGLF